MRVEPPSITWTVCTGGLLPNLLRKAGPMLTELFQKSTLFYLLLKIDRDLSEQVRKAGCPHCGGNLHYSNYPRKPRGGPNGLPDEYLVRFSLCCDRENCRRRTLPPSCRFKGRRVYWHGVMLVVMTLRQGLSAGKIAEKFHKLFGMTRNTVARWVTWYRDVFPSTSTWKRVRGLIGSTIRNDNLPSDLVTHYIAHSPSRQEALIHCLKLLS